MQVRIEIDIVLMAEIIAHFNPKIVELHNYIATGSLAQKISNWKILNGTVFSMQIKF
jgi:hydrocephalus-inducing protein